MSYNLPLNLTYDDIQLIPQYSNVMSRADVSLETDLSRNFKLKLPFVASPMDTVCGFEMAAKMMKLGGVGIVHRFMSVKEQVSITSRLEELLDYEEIWDVWDGIEIRNIPICAAIGVGDKELNRALSLINNGVNVILIDVAHGHHKNVKLMIHSLRSEFGTDVDIIAGNVATWEGTRDLCEWGVDGVRCGVGGGSLCSTRIETGHGVPNVTSIMESVEASDVPVMADGGIRRAGDVAKALGLGASTVMLGSLLSGTNESPGPVLESSDGLYKRYRGSASLETKSAHGQKESHIEGVSTVVPYKGGVKYAIKKLEEGLRSALSYSGSHNLKEYHNNAEFIQITNAGIVEARPHLKS